MRCWDLCVIQGPHVCPAGPGKWGSGRFQRWLRTFKTYIALANDIVNGFSLKSLLVEAMKEAFLRGWIPFVILFVYDGLLFRGGGVWV